MSKRQCPFEYDLLPQMKVRIDQKQYDSKHESNMAKIHDKTLRMLFNGAKQLNDNAQVHNTASFSSKITDQNKNISEFCTHCNDLNVIEFQCSFCDKWMCQSCSAMCLECHECFCASHFFKLYHQDDECICLNCADYNYKANSQ